jgi:hypothetical protein
MRERPNGEIAAMKVRDPTPTHAHHRMVEAIQTNVLPASRLPKVMEALAALDQSKLTPLLRLKYHDSSADAVADLSVPEEIGRVFAAFQKYLQQRVA